MKAIITVTSTKTMTIASYTSMLLAVVELIALGILYSLLRYNAKKKTQLQEATLTEKYQVNENLRSIRLLIPMMITHFCCFMPTLIAFPLYYAIDQAPDSRQYPIFNEAFGLTILYAVLLPVILFWRHKSLRDNLQKSLGVFNRVEPEGARADGRTQEQVRHFALLSSAWEREIAKR
uniref:G protein-coupled receptor n=1 Tax=Plectus sambesii TaxID=2011161 RepID=A0A914VQH2_9BILA